MSLCIGSMLFCAVFIFWMIFSSLVVTFYRDDNVDATGPLLIEAARLVKLGHLPLHTYYVGGGGGTPLISIMQPAVLDPLKLVPAMVFGHVPELMMNVIVALHLALFAWGGWFLATALGAPTWSGLVASLALGFSGSYVVGSGNYEALFMPYTFLPWLLGGLWRLAGADTLRDTLWAHIVTAWAGLSTFFSGGPTAGFYGFLVVGCFLPFILSANRGRWLRFAARLIPQVLLFLVAVGPLLWEAKKVHDYYGRHHEASEWITLSVPLHAYMGLFIPRTVSVWNHIGMTAVFSNILLACGFVPAWFIMASAVAKPRAFTDWGFAALAVGIALFILVLSPAEFGLERLFSETPVLTLFKYPFRGITAFHVLVVFVFLALARVVDLPKGLPAKIALVCFCVVGSVASFVWEYHIAKPGTDVISWFVTNRFYEDRETWTGATLNKLRSAGYLMNICRPLPRGVWFEKPRLFFAGNLGAQFQVKTVHRYILAAQAPAYAQLGMHFSGLTMDWPAVKRFIQSCQSDPHAGPQEWETGIGPKDVSELASKTYVGGIIVETSLKEPMDYFSKSPEWELVESRPAATAFVRKWP